jgi:hypothetical protein
MMYLNNAALLNCRIVIGCPASLLLLQGVLIDAQMSDLEGWAEVFCSVRALPV